MDHDKALAEWLFGADLGGPGDHLFPAAAGHLGPGLLRRMLGFFQGDPVSGGQQLTPTGVTRLTVPDGAESAIITVEVANIRVTFGGLIPTSAVGLLLPVGYVGTITGRPSLLGFQTIQSGGAAVVDVEYFT